MGKVYEGIESKVEEFLRAQHMFFVATAPMAADGLVNLSPKGLDTFTILDPLTVAYLDFTGSGIETVAHLRENARVVLMFCAFEGPPKIIRLHGEGEVLEPGHADWDELRPRFPGFDDARSIIRVHCRRISDSCGFGVPLYDYQGQRSQLTAYAERKGAEGLREYQKANNRTSLDGLPGLAGLDDP